MLTGGKITMQKKARGFLMVDICLCHRETRTVYVVNSSWTWVLRFKEFGWKVKEMYYGVNSVSTDTT